MAATLAVERPKSSFERPDSNIRATRLMREKLTTDFMTEFKYVATQALSLDTAEHKVSEKRSPEALSMALVNSCWGDNGFVNLERAEGILLKIHDTLTLKGNAITDLVTNDIPYAVERVMLVYLFDGNLKDSIRVAKDFGILGSLNPLREEAAALNIEWGRELMGHGLQMTEFIITYEPAPSVAITKKHYTKELIGPLLRTFD